MPIFSDDAINAFQTAVMSNPANIEIYNDIGKVGGYGSQADNPIRIYYYDSKKEFRLQCEAIKRKGNQGDIISIHKDDNKPLEFDIELLRQGSTKYSVMQPLLNNKASAQKFFTYY